MTFERYWPLLLMAAIPYFWWVRGRTLTDLSPSHLKLGTIVRSVMVGLLILALTEPTLHRSRDWLSVVYMLDVSQSVSPQAISSAIDWIEEADETGGGSHSAFMAFASNSLVFDDLDELRTVPVTDRLIEGVIDQSATDLEGALAHASRSFAPYHLKRLVLFSDGNENAGNVKDKILRLKEENVRIFTRPIPARFAADAWVETVMAPAEVTQDELFPLEVHVHSQVSGSGEVEIRLGSEPLETRDVNLEAGINRIGFEIQVSETGPLTIEAEVRLEGDRFPANNVFRESIVVQGPPRILYVEGRPASAQYLQNALEQAGIEVEVVTPAETPHRVDQFDAYEAIILSDVRADALTQPQMEALATYVRDLGGGFILAGGDSVYGEEGYSETTLEEILPVRFDLEREPPTVALIIILDKSGSMGGQKIDLAKEASKAAVDVLLDEHLIGLIAFDYDYYWPVPLQPASNSAEINRNISTILAGGETNIYPALEEAHNELINVEAEVKHVILLSDGRSLPDDFQELVHRMAEATVTVSTVAVGSGADRELLANIAEWGQGRTYFIEDAERVPQVFTEEAELATKGTLREEPFQVVVLKDVEAFKGIDFANSPPLLGYVATLEKDTAEILLQADDENPLLARWQYGLGKTVAFTSDVKDRWAADWLSWDGYSKFWPQLVRETMRRQENGEFDLRIEKDGDEARISITALEEDGGFRNELNSQIRVLDPQQNVSVLDVYQSGPGTYETEFPVPERGPYVFRVVGDEAGVSRILPYSYPEEYHFYPSDTDLLQEVSSLTGGTFDTEVADIFATNGESIVRPTALWPYLASIALLLYLADLLLRRVRLFETASARTPVPASSARPKRGLSIS